MQSISIPHPTTFSVNKMPFSLNEENSSSEDNSSITPTINKNYKTKEEVLPSWFDKKIDNKELSKEEEEELDNLLKEFS